MRAGDSPDEHYQAGEAAASIAAGQLERQALRTSRLRTFAFFGMAGPFLLLETTPRGLWPLLIGSGLVGLAIFLALIRRHGRLKRALRRARLRETLNQEGRARLRRNWDSLPPPPLAAAPDHHPSAGDLDLAGRASLAHLVGRVVTAPGRALLRQIVLDPFAALPAIGSELIERIRSEPSSPTTAPGQGWVEELRERQEAVGILAEESAFREQFELLGREIGRRGTLDDTADFLEWLGRPRWLDDHKGILLSGRLLALYTPLTLVTWMLGLTPGFLPVVGALAALGLHRAVAPHSTRRFEAAEAGEGDLVSWSALLGLAEKTPEGSILLARSRESFRAPAPGAAKAIGRLVRIIDTASARRSSLAHFPLVALFAWDIHVLDWLERWHAKHASAVGSWVRSLGHLEVLCAFGGLLYDHPKWTFPEFLEDPDLGLRAAALGHPLLDPNSCIHNDAELPPAGTLLLVTGSNMAGKTTLLRSIGVNQTLALAGGPVAATVFQTRPILPWTAMRVTDSLEGGVSYFLAELQRLKRVVEAAQERPTLYLLDEILQGTNSAERRTAARIVLQQLLKTDSVGAITTHDLTLAETDELQKRSVNVHFREEVREIDGQRKLEFDYRLRPGAATSRNALLLLEIVGLSPTSTSD